MSKYTYKGDFKGQHHNGAIFTIELGCLIDNNFDIGLNKYPIFDDKYRNLLNNKIVEHFWFREIGLETPQLFKMFLNRKMNEIMPYYNQLYKSELIEINPLYNYYVDTDELRNVNEDGKRKSETNKSLIDNANTTSESTANTKGRALASTTPQMQLSGREDYATNVTDSTGESTSIDKSTSSANSNDVSQASADTNILRVEDYIRHVRGNIGFLQSSALMEYRRTFLNIDMMVIEELNECFMGIYTDYWNAL